MATRILRLVSLLLVLTVTLPSWAAVYEPAIASDSEVCVFFEANSSVTDAPKIWVWEGNTGNGTLAQANPETT